MEKTNFKFGRKSLANLQGVHPDVVAIVTLGLTKYCSHDFSVIEGVRSADQAYRNWGKGRTVQELARVGGAAKYAQPNAKKVTWLRHPLNSKHCLQRDGFSHAVDLLPVVGGWQAPVATFKAMDDAFKKAAKSAATLSNARRRYTFAAMTCFYSLPVLKLHCSPRR